LPGMYLPNYRALITLIDEGEFKELDETMGAWTLKLLDETEEELCASFPHREALLREAFTNYREDRYASSITLLLTQIDGMCHDLFDIVFFKVKQKAPEVREKIQQLGLDMFAEILLHPILIKSGINASDEQIEKGEFSQSPHRHAILHGRDVGYANELNNLKIISFAGFMGSTVRGITEQAREVKGT